MGALTRWERKLNLNYWYWDTIKCELGLLLNLKKKGPAKTIREVENFELCTTSVVLELLIWNPDNWTLLSQQLETLNNIWQWISLNTIYWKKRNNYLFTAPYPSRQLAAWFVWHIKTTCFVVDQNERMWQCWWQCCWGKCSLQATHLHPQLIQTDDFTVVQSGLYFFPHQLNQKKTTKLYIKLREKYG